jgi:hypothetical protein
MIVLDQHNQTILFWLLHEQTLMIDQVALIEEYLVGMLYMDPIHFVVIFVLGTLMQPIIISISMSVTIMTYRSDVPCSMYLIHVKRKLSSFHK